MCLTWQYVLLEGIFFLPEKQDYSLSACSVCVCVCVRTAELACKVTLQYNTHRLCVCGQVYSFSVCEREQDCVFSHRQDVSL